jgi:hypothetical protein
MIAHNNAADPRTIGGAKILNHHEMVMTANTNKCKDKMEIAELVGSLRFIVESLDEAAREATIAANAIEAKNIGAGYYHMLLFREYARSACGGFRDIIGAPAGEAA